MMNKSDKIFTIIYGNKKETFNSTNNAIIAYIPENTSGTIPITNKDALIELFLSKKQLEQHVRQVVNPQWRK